MVVFSKIVFSDGTAMFFGTNTKSVPTAISDAMRYLTPIQKSEISSILAIKKVGKCSDYQESLESHFS